MKKENKKSLKYVYTTIFISILLVLGFYFFNPNTNEETVVATSSTSINSSENMRKNYADFLVNHPFRKTMKLSKKERMERELTPNKFFEQEFLYTSDPALLRPAPERLYALQKELKVNDALRAPSAISDWMERGPSNVGGRTHSLMFAPGSTTKVFAGGVSGGLWINNDISNSNSVWQEVTGMPKNLSVMSITVDPNNTNIMYAGTGEVYTYGDVVGNGVYKSTNGGNNWFELYTGGTDLSTRLAFVQDIVAWNNPVTNQTEVYFGAGSNIYREEVISQSGNSNWTFLGTNSVGLYKSTDGQNFARLTDAVFHAPNNFYSPNDFDISADGSLWMGTRRNIFGSGGGVVFKNDGNGWVNVRNLGTQSRVEVACSKQDPNKIYFLTQDITSSSNPVKIFLTQDGLATAPVSLPQPNDADTNIPASDFTRNQSFYDLMIGVDPSNDANVFVGGIDIFKSTTSGSSWTQLSHWYGGFGKQYVHADQHGIAFATGASNSMLFGNDGGVFYSNNGGTNISERNNGYNVTQFYKGAINQNASSEILLAGAQDNGSQLAVNASPGINATNEVTGGDGCWVFIDKDDQYMISSYVYNNYRYININGVYIGNFQGSDNTGDFVNQCGLDSDTNILLSNATTGSNYRIYRWVINPATTGVTKTVLTNSMLNTIPTFFVASPNISDRFIVGTALGKIIRLDDVSSTPTWTDISMPGQVGAVSDIRYGATENDIMVTFHNYGVNSIWYTNDGGTTWVSKEGDLPDMPVKCILQSSNNADKVIIGTALGVWKTSNWTSSSPNWLQMQNGISDVKIMSFDYKASTNTVLAATYGRGMYSANVDEVLGTPDNTLLSTTISLFPNPAKDILNIQSKQFPITNIEIYDVRGRKVQEKDFLGESAYKIDISGLKTAIYLVKINTESGSLTKRIAKK